MRIKEKLMMALENELNEREFAEVYSKFVKCSVCPICDICQSDHTRTNEESCGEYIECLIKKEENEVTSDGDNDEKTNPNKQWWIFTFGSGQKHAGHYVKIQGTFNSARQRMIEEYGKAWGFHIQKKSGLPCRMIKTDCGQWKRNLG